MYLKEAFQYQNYLSGLSSRADYYLSSSASQYATKTVQTHLRSKVNADAEDEVINLAEDRQLPYTADQLVDFLVHITAQKEALAKAISDAKKSAAFDIDMAVSANRARREVAKTLAKMAAIRPSERTTTGYSYKFNAEGNQVRYAYDVKEVTTIDFNRNKVKSVAKTLSEEAEKTSTEIDKLMVELVVDYTPEFSINDSFEDALETYFSE